MTTTPRSSVSNSSFCFLPTEIEGFNALTELALDLHWSWNQRSDAIWKTIDPELWHKTENPWAVLQNVSKEKIIKTLDDPPFREKVESLLKEQREAIRRPAWFQNHYSENLVNSIAYFSLEFMLSEALPIYSGGLGNVAGDQLKAASDLGVPVVGIGLLYQQGYFHQLINDEGEQEALYPYNDPGQLPIIPLRYPNGEWIRLSTEISGDTIYLKTWEVQIGRVKLYLLDSNDPANLPVYRGITSQLYGGKSETRIKQEIILGIGGWKLLEALGLQPEVAHINEGHAAFAILERSRSFMVNYSQPFEVALAATRSGNIFTTHTAVLAGFDCFSPELVIQHLGDYAQKRLGISHEELLALGRNHPQDQSEPFNMAYLAIHGSGTVSGVSRLHQKVSRNLFKDLFPRWSVNEIPVDHITNGVHMPSWDAKASDELWTKVCGKDRWLGTLEGLEEKMLAVPLEEIWKLRSQERASLIDYVRERYSQEQRSLGESEETVLQARKIFDVNTFTIGFARRFATYKRPNLLLRDPERLVRLLTNRNRPVQLVLAGKAHPSDLAGQDLIREWHQFIQRAEVKSQAIFLSDYDLRVTEQLVKGVDIWLNTPRRPWEACGTSGMKVLVNGGINLSELDGWWAEAYIPEMGWAIGDGEEHANNEEWDRVESNTLFERLEQEAIPEFYQRDQNKVPVAWTTRIRESMARLTPRFSANRSVREYTERFYIPAAKKYRLRYEQQCRLAKEIIQWKKELFEKWYQVRFGEMKVEPTGENYLFKVQVYWGALDPKYISVELFSEGLNRSPCQSQKMTRMNSDDHSRESSIYSAVVPGSRPIEEYTPRVIPFFEGVSVPLEERHILWHK